MMVPLEGPIGVGTLLDAIMVGCLIVQSCVYYKNSGGDSWLFKILVSLILFLLLCHLGCMTAWLWASTEINAEATSMPDYAVILFGVSSVLSAAVLFIERCFFSHRILKLSKNHMLSFVLSVSCIFSFTVALGAAAVFFTNVTADLMSQLSNDWIFPLALITGLSTDLSICVATTIHLRLDAETGGLDSLGYLARIPVYVAETGATTSVFGATVLVVYWFTKNNSAWLGLVAFMPGVFANAILAAINVRRELCVDIQHQRVNKIGEKLIDECAKRPPILIAISKQVNKKSEECPA